jgi:hydrogenase maturation protease
MNATVTPGRTARPLSVVTTDDRVAVDILVCGSPDRGDDGAAIAAARLLRGLPAGARVRIVGQLDIDDLLAVPAGGAVVIVDAATGVAPGRIVELPLRGFIGAASETVPRSSHALAMPEVIGVADMVRGRPLDGRIVVIGGRQYGLGRPMSRRVATAVPALAEAVRQAVAGLSGPEAPATEASTGGIPAGTSARGRAR